ncbi:MAG: hypothetical protein ACJA16_005205, partial [Akkermansiaceae bacterium]
LKTCFRGRLTDEVCVGSSEGLNLMVHFR